METTFNTRQLHEAYEDAAVGTRLWGEKVARLYIKRIDALKAAPVAKDLFALRSLCLHPLKGNRKGEHAMNLDGFWRLVVTFQRKEMKAVCVEEVSKHYDD